VAVLIRVYSTIAKFKLPQGRTPAFNDFLSDRCSVPVQPFCTHQL